MLARLVAFETACTKGAASFWPLIIDGTDQTAIRCRAELRAMPARHGHVALARDVGRGRSGDPSVAVLWQKRDIAVVTAKAAGPAGRAINCRGGHRGTRSLRRLDRPHAARVAPTHSLLRRYARCKRLFILASAAAQLAKLLQQSEIKQAFNSKADRGGSWVWISHSPKKHRPFSIWPMILAKPRSPPMRRPGSAKARSPRRSGRNWPSLALAGFMFPRTRAARASRGSRRRWCSRRFRWPALRLPRFCRSIICAPI